jgi:hypothetical protein
VTVEIAVALPTLVLVTVAALWGVTTASAQIACVDAVRAGARAAARGESLPAVRTVVERAAPPGARVEVRRGKETTEVAVSAVLRPPALTGFPALTVRAHALAATEPGVSGLGASGPVVTGPYEGGCQERVAGAPQCGTGA